FAEETVYIPNQELMLEYGNAVEDDNNWDMVAKAVKAAGDLLTATLAKDSDAVARGIAEAHLETSHLQYNDENALSYTISLAYYTARQKYLLIRELPTGKGFADLVFLPRPKQEHLPALILELKWDKAAQTAIRQIKTKDYPKTLQDFQGRMLLVGVSYDKGSRRHECLIEEWEKS
ncbi:MAG: PD-(D/E)XK nuclease domain-containing protein, partial [Selenomonadaceae bacterium]|nr:PD-(D/E)XK nuclease domain-containing protein [Selenomonadaceae bacterium]